MEYKIVESYSPEEYDQHGYDVYRVETDNISDVRIVNKVNGTEYFAESAIKCKDGNETIYVVTVWCPLV
jgi:tRNA A37 threonylcarbamoyladenosine biosynthesis protein TsaE